jgi:hypothetical protein
VEVLVSSRGAFGAVPNDRSRSSVGNSRLLGIEGRLGIKPGLTHCILFGPPLIGALGGANTGRSEGAYMGGGRGAIGVRSAFGPVGMLAGKLFGEACMEEGTPPLRGPNPGFELEATSCGTWGGNGALGNCGDALVRKAACGAIGGGRGLGAGPCGGDLAGAEVWVATDGTGGGGGGGGTAAGVGGGARMG